MIDIDNWPEMRQALAVRDIGQVFRLLADAGVQQRRIAELVGMSQPEVSEIISGRAVLNPELLNHSFSGVPNAMS